MKTLKMKCTLLSDIVINASAATQGEQTTLDFIPGNNFLGIVASLYDKMSTSEQMEIFHSGKVRFGDANPVVDGSKIKSVHVPATIFYPKGKYVWQESYASQGYSRETDKEKNGTPMQLKQCRNGYYVFDKGEGTPVTVNKHFAIKSAYDRSLRHAQDSMMYGYESIDKGQEFYFEVEIDNEELTGIVHDSLVGIHRIGRSRTAEYGLVKIEDADFDDVKSNPAPIDTIKGKRVAVYAESRLIFLDNAGQPTFRPKASDLGLEGEIDWDLSQIRTFEYAPWNGKRQTRDADRCGIEKGSVFFVDCTSAPSSSRYVGSYNNEGFGHVVYNPDFLCYRGDNGKTTYKFLKTETETASNNKQVLKGSPLLDYLAAKKNDIQTQGDIADQVNEFVDHYGKLFTGMTFASQWGSIRKIALANPTKQAIIRELFDKAERRWHYPSPSNPKEGYENVNVGYLAHGVAAKKWEKNHRKDLLRQFIDSIKDENYVQQAVVNLASEMGKKCTRYGKD